MATNKSTPSCKRRIGTFITFCTFPCSPIDGCPELDCIFIIIIKRRNRVLLNHVSSMAISNFNDRVILFNSDLSMSSAASKSLRLNTLQNIRYFVRTFSIEFDLISLTTEYKIVNWLNSKLR